MNALKFITSTRSTAENERAGVGVHQLSVIGYRRQGERVYFLESNKLESNKLEKTIDGFVSETAEAPTLFSMNLTGQYAGRTVPLRQPANQNDDASPERIVMNQVAELAPLLRPLRRIPNDSLEMSTRVVRRTALVLGHHTVPVRKFVIKLTVGRPNTAGPWRHHYISTYLRPRVTLARVYEIPNRDQAIAILSYVGLPYGLGDNIEQPVLVDLIGR